MLKLAGVIIDLKPNEGFQSPTSRTSAGKVVNCVDQAVLELLAGTFHTQQKLLVVLTDITTVAYAYTILSNESFSSFDILEFSGLNLTEMAWLIRHHLDSYCVPDQRYRIPNDISRLEKPTAAQFVQAFKKAKKSSTEDVAYEHFKELMELTDLGTEERAQAIREFLHPIWLDIKELQEEGYFSMFV